MEITRTPRGAEYEIKLKGRLDATWSDHVAAALAECLRSGQHQLLVDMAAVDYISSAGIRILVLYSRQLGNIQGRLGVINASDNVRKVLELAGLDKMLLVEPSTAAAPSPAGENEPCSVALAEPGAAAQTHELDPSGTLRLHWPGNSLDWFEGRSPPEACPLVQCPVNMMGIGLGTLVSGEASLAQPFGEFLAVAGVAVCQAADGSNKPDYVVTQGALQPEVKVGYGLLGFGAFRRLVRFDKGPQQPSVPLSTVVKACLEASGSDLAGLVLVAETACLIGASLQKPVSSTEGPTQDMFSFPEIRDWLSFTAEPAFPNSTCVIAGFAATNTRGADLRLFKPLVPSGELFGHFHAAALPYQPLRKGKVDLAETIRPLFETEQVLGVLHLLNDWRDLSGAGESRFLRGACWCAPATP